MMRMLAVLSALLVVCCALFVPAKADLVINQTGPLNIVAGDSITQNITFKFQSSSTKPVINFTILTLVLPDPFGIDVTYSNVPKTISPNTAYTIQMHIATSMLLMPGQYVITSAIRANQTHSTPPPIKPHTIHASTGNQSPVNPPPPNPPPNNNNTNNTIPPPHYYIEESGTNWFWIIVIIIVILALVTLLIFFIVRKRKKE